MMPSIERSYLVSPNNRTASSGTALTDNRTTLLAIVSVMFTFGTHPWTCGGSSNGVTYDLTAVSKWLTIADLVWHASGSAFSWIILADGAGAGPGTQILIALDVTIADGSTASVYISPSAGFSGGSTTTRPTATDETPYVVQGAWGGVTVSADSVVHVIHESSGVSPGLAVIIMSAGAPIGFWFLSKVKDPSSSWSNAFWGCVRTGTDAMTLDGLNEAAGVKAKIASVVSMYLTVESFGPSNDAVTDVSYPDDQSGEFTVAPIGLFCTTAGSRGRKGSAFDLWWGQTVNGNGDTYPGDGSRQLVQFGHLVFVWNGVAAQVT